MSDETPVEKAQRLALAHSTRPIAPEPEGLCIHELTPSTCTICKHGTSLGVVTPCRACQADVVWCRTERHRNMLVDAQPTPEGNLVRVGTEDGKALMSAKPPVVAAVLREAGQPLYMSHFATCEFANEFRRR